jgi:hypothetical protein
MITIRIRIKQTRCLILMLSFNFPSLRLLG